MVRAAEVAGHEGWVQAVCTGSMFKPARHLPTVWYFGCGTKRDELGRHYEVNVA